MLATPMSMIFEGCLNVLPQQAGRKLHTNLEIKNDTIFLSISLYTKKSQDWRLHSNELTEMCTRETGGICKIHRPASLIHSPK